MWIQVQVQVLRRAAGIGDPRQMLEITSIAGIPAWVGALALKTR